VSAPHPDYEDVRCPACGLPICRNGEDEHNECVLAVAKERDDLKAQVEALGSRLCEYHATNPLNETVERLEKERDEARRVAQKMYEYAGTIGGDMLAFDLAEDYPWLKE
jgi:uncharacterized coiled-coil DUF342 family protein